VGIVIVRCLQHNNVEILVEIGVDAEGNLDSRGEHSRVI